MKKYSHIVLPFLFIAAGFIAIGAGKKSSQQDDSKARDIIKKAEDIIKGNTSVAEITVEVVRPTWKRTMSMKAWSKGDKYSMILVTGPAKDAGTVFLKRDKEVWNWLPSIERVIKLPPSMMTQSWMGTDFTNDDLVKEASSVNDYTHRLLGDSTIGDRKCWKIEMIPLPQAAVVWSKVYVWVDQKDYLELRLEFYDEDNKLVSIMKASDIKTLGGRILPSKMEMIPMDKKGQETVMMYNTITFDQPIDDNYFTTENMKKAR